jgi:hypothetical protein
MRQSPPGLLLRCGCEISFVEGESPVCPTHGNRSVVRVLRMPKPRFRGVASGPCVRSEDLAPFVGRIPGMDGAKT